MRVLLCCPKCRQRYTAAVRQIGRRFDCHKCGVRLAIPEPHHLLHRSRVVRPRVVPTAATHPVSWKQENQIVVGPDARLPSHCILCDQPTDQLLKRTYAFSTPFTGDLAYVAAGLSLLFRRPLRVYESLTVRIPVCRGCWRPKIVKTIWQVTVGIPLLIILPMVAIQGALHVERPSKPADRIVAFLGLLASLPGWYLCHLANSNHMPLKLERIGQVRWRQEEDGSEHFIWLTGACPRYLKRLPDWDEKLEVGDSGGSK